MKYIIPLLLLGISYTAMAQTMTNDPAATKILKKLKKQYQGYKSLEVVFKLNLELPEQEPELQEGTIGQQGEKYFVKMKDQEIYSDGATIWLYMVDNKEVQLNNVETDEEFSMLSPTDMLQIYESDDFVYAVTGEKTINGVNCTQIEFKPTSLDSEYSKMRLLVDPKAKKMHELKVFAKDGSRYTLTVDNMTPNKSFVASDFTFDPAQYEGIHIEDLRID
jgi:outer membrane lipoprotein-sorting protein